MVSAIAWPPEQVAPCVFVAQTPKGGRAPILTREHRLHGGMERGLQAVHVEDSRFQTDASQESRTLHTKAVISGESGFKVFDRLSSLAPPYPAVRFWLLADY